MRKLYFVVKQTRAERGWKNTGKGVHACAAITNKQTKMEKKCWHINKIS